MTGAARHRIVSVPSLLWLAACSSTTGGSTPPPPIGTMVLLAGDSQTVLTNLDTPIAPTVRITDANGQPVAGVTVTFAVLPYGGSVTDSVVQTGADGTASVGSWTVYALPGVSELQAAAADVSGSPVTFSANVFAPLLIHPTNGTDQQQALGGAAVAVPPQVAVHSGGSVVGLQVVFRVIGGGGSVTGDTAVVNAVGVATVGSWTLGPTPGLNQLRGGATADRW